MIRRIIATLAMASAACGAAQIRPPIPYTLTFVQADAPNLPPLQSYCLADVSATQWLILGGRTVGLHTFNPSGNFVAPNTILWSINPTSGTAQKVADLSKIDPTYGDPLTATNQQCEYSPESGYWYIVGGYGSSHAAKNFITFPTIIQIPVAKLVEIANSGQPAAKVQAAVAALLENPANLISDPSMKVTGGALSQTSVAGLWLLSFGQIFDGQYNPFGGGFTQTYTQAVLPFTISENPFAIHPRQAMRSALPGAPFNRRDFEAGYDIDPATKRDRFAMFGGVFRPGAIAGYDYPVYLTSNGLSISATPDTSVKQHFGFYEGPMIVAWNGTTVFHTFFGGIGHYFLNQSKSQSEVYRYVSREGRNDGLPFIEDIATLMENGQGQYQEYVSADPIPNNMLHGASAEFIPNLAESSKFQGVAGSVVNLSAFAPGEKKLIGYIYGGIEAANPLPCKPSTGTIGTNALYQVYLTMSPWQGLVPASQAKEAVGYFTHGDPKVKAPHTNEAKDPAALQIPSACSSIALSPKVTKP